MSLTDKQEAIELISPTKDSIQSKEKHRESEEINETASLRIVVQCFGRRSSCASRTQCILAALLFSSLAIVATFFKPSIRLWDLKDIGCDVASSTDVIYKSYGESLGWYNVPDEQWDLMKKYHFDTRHRQWESPDTLLESEKKLNFDWKPSFSCPMPPFRMGEGDGGKVLCDPWRTLKQQDCLVISVGSSGHFEFEEGVLEVNPECEVHTIDMTYFGPVPDSVTFHRVGLADFNGIRPYNLSDHNTIMAEFKTIDTLLKDLNLLNRRIDIFKIDCEGCERTVYPGFYADGVNIVQLAIEVHFFRMDEWWRPNYKMMEALHRNGFVIFSKEPNTLGCNGACVEFTFLRFNRTIFN